MVSNITNPRKYLDPKINLSEFRQTLCETIGP
ncbi:hypothetical protein LEP1GSC051_2222, partial [Leptospira sp. P2653]